MVDDARALRVTIVNPLGRALAHYSLELTHLLERAGAQVDHFVVLEPSQRQDRSRTRWILEYLRARIAAARTADRVIVVWPALGFLDVLTNLSSKCWIVVHDPVPLVRSLGSGRFMRWLVGCAPVKRFIVHSDTAREDLAPRARPKAHTLPHPMLPPVHKHKKPSQSTVRVLGQFKGTRNLPILEKLAASRGLEGYKLEIVGRGWPAVPGWVVSDAFISESELDDLIDTSSAVLLPYHRFYQSGIALRALERATPVVGPRDSSLSTMYRSEHPALVSDASNVLSWVEAIASAVKEQQAGAPGSADTPSEVYEKAFTSWARWLDT